VKSRGLSAWLWLSHTRPQICDLIYDCSIDSLLEWSGINALLYYGPTLVRSIGMRGDTVPLLVAGGIGIVQLLAVLPAIIWIDKVGRRSLLRGE